MRFASYGDVPTPLIAASGYDRQLQFARAGCQVSASVAGALNASLPAEPPLRSPLRLRHSLFQSTENLIPFRFFQHRLKALMRR